MMYCHTFVLDGSNYLLFPTQCLLLTTLKYMPFEDIVGKEWVFASVRPELLYLG